MKKSTKKLTLDREALRSLTTTEIRAAHGGIGCNSQKMQSCQDPTGAGNLVTDSAQTQGNC
jgi:hypothetical protein